MFSFGYSFFLSGPIIGYTSLSYFYIFSIVFYICLLYTSDAADEL